jgi:UDP-N-acetylglucosamine 2-epimerase (non-hydrolysing)
MVSRIAILTTGRQDWGILRSTVDRLIEDDRFRPSILVGGMHLSAVYGRTIEGIEADGYPVAERLDWIGPGETPPPTDQAGAALAAVGRALRDRQPEAILLVGDRFETLAAASAATIEGVPIVHLHGGEETRGAFDDPFRHAISKLSHLHLVSHDEYRRRLMAIGEDPATIHVVGAPGIDQVHRQDLPDRIELERELGVTLRPPVVVVTVQPATLAVDPAEVVGPVIAAMDAVPATYVVTLPNADPGHDAIRLALREAVVGHTDRVVVEALGETRYWALMRNADALLGNSSSALIEAPALGLPAVDVGDRQAGRVRGPSVISIPAEGAAVAPALRPALDPGLRARLRLETGPYGDGRSAERIVDILSRWAPPTPLRKTPVTPLG